MYTVGFTIPRKENENRRAIIPSDLANIKNPSQIFLEEGYGNVLGFKDEDYQEFGANICSFEQALEKDIICSPKIGDEEYLENLKNQVIFGWAHLVQNRDITDKVINSNLTVYAWEDMFELGRHCFWHNNLIAGSAAVLNASVLHGIDLHGKKVAVIGRGNTAMGAIKILNGLGAHIDVYNKDMEQLLNKNISEYDVIVNCLLWDTSRKDHIIYKKDIQRMKKNALIIDVSCDRAGAIETSIPTSIENPIYDVNGITHYVVDHVPSLMYRSATEGISSVVSRYIDELIENNIGNTLKDAKAVENGIITDYRINQFQNRD